MATPLTESHHVRRRWITIVAVASGLILVWLAIRLIEGRKIEPGLLNESIDQTGNRPLGAVQTETLPIRREVIGSVQSRVPIEAESRVAERITEVRVHTGERVKQGQLMVMLDGSELIAQVAQAQGQLAAAQGELSRATADEKRFSALFARGSVTASERDAAEAAYRGAAGRVAQAQAMVAGARAGLEYARIRSPVDGVVVERLAEPGDMAMPGKPLVRLYDESALRVELEVPEDLARHIEPGTPVDVTVDANGAVYRSQLSEIVPAADSASRSFLVRAPLPSGRHLRPGMFARATFTVGNQTVLTVPRDAIEEVGQLDTVRIISSGRIETQMVSLGRRFGDRIEVLSGLRAGQRLILDRQGAESR